MAPKKQGFLSYMIRFPGWMGSAVSHGEMGASHLTKSPTVIGDLTSTLQKNMANAG
jgi:hypothetical protein